MDHQPVKTRCTSCGYEKEYLFGDFEGPEREKCSMCGCSLEILNLEDLKREHISNGLKEILQKKFRELGIEGTIETLETMQDTETAMVYIEALRKHFPQLKVRYDRR